MNNIALAWSLIISPSAAFAELRARPRFWFPLILLTLAGMSLLCWYYSVVDVGWLVDHLMSGNERLANMPEDVRAKVAAVMTRNSMLLSSVVSVLLVVPAACALQAVYYLLAGKVMGIQQSFKQWFAMTCWSSLPVLVATVASAAVLAIAGSNVQIGPEELQVLSLNELFFHIPMSGHGSALLGNLTLITPWAWGLTIICIRTWTDRSWAFSAIFALLPSVVWYGCWAAIAFR